MFKKIEKMLEPGQTLCILVTPSTNPELLTLAISRSQFSKEMESPLVVTASAATLEAEINRLLDMHLAPDATTTSYLAGKAVPEALQQPVPSVIASGGVVAATTRKPRAAAKAAPVVPTPIEEQPEPTEIFGTAVAHTGFKDDEFEEFIDPDEIQDEPAAPADEPFNPFAE